MMADEAAEGYPRDLLLRFGGSACAEEQPLQPPPLPATAVGEPTEEIELSLGLSLGGCFGSEPKAKKMLVRSSSVASLWPLPGGCSDQPAAPAAVAAAPLTRTSSLPAETEEMRRKRREMQSLKRMEAKRKRLERRNSIKPGAGAGEAAKEQPEEAVDSKMGGRLDPGIVSCIWSPDSGGQFGGKVNGATPSVLQGWAAGLVRGASLPADGFPLMSPGSLVSQGSCSSGILEFESRPAQVAAISGTSNGAKAKSPSTGQATTVPSNSAVGSSMNCPRAEQNPRWKMAGRAHSMGEVERSMMEEMPCVSATGDGPDGRRVEGFLYKYRKVEEVRIVCVCHGRFHTPAEFVRHAGGSDVTNPLRHIVVSPSPPAFQ